MPVLGAPTYLLLARERAPDSSHFLQVRLLSTPSVVACDAARKWPVRIPINSLQSFRRRCSTLFAYNS